jgi:GNAT superfamily N-acetyltransferase
MPEESTRRHTAARDARIVHELDPAPAGIAEVRAGLLRYNEAAIGPVAIRRHAWFLEDATGTIRGGLVGFLAWRWLSIDLLWVDEPLRGQGHGRALLEQAEDVARADGCVGAKLDTFEFQARPFYERLGYEVYGVLEGYPADTCTYLMKKAL